MFRRVALVLLALAASTWVARADEPELREKASAGLRKAVEYYRKNVATEGGYLWRYSDDMARREGEGKATAAQVWVQPPGTPAVGLAYLAAYHATGDSYYLEAATEVARTLARGQLRSGGWDYRIEFDPKLRKDHAYRADGGKGGRNVTTLDDNTTQEAVRLLMRVDVALKQKDAVVHDAAVFALDSLLKAQYPNGAWPQRFDSFPDPEKFPVKKASYPDTWPREFPGKDYKTYYTFNDNALADVIDVMFEASRVYGEDKYRKAAEKAGGFIILAQLPDPQPGWAQQYDADMHPAWARRFEPPAVTGGEAQGVMLTLLRLYRETGDKKYLEPIPRALDYYRKSQLPDSRLARFYELKTNKPLYFTKDYKLTYADDDVPTHYAFKVGSRLDAIAKEYTRVKNLPAGGAKPQAAPARGKPTAGQIAEVKKVLAALDEKGRWVEDGRLRSHGPDDPTRRVISMQTYIRNIGVLSGYLAAAQKFPDYRPVAGWPQLPPKVELGPVSAVATDAADRVYVAHRGPKPVLVFDRDGKFLRSWGDDHVKTAHGLRIDSTGNVWVTDIGNHQVMKFDPEGKLLLSLGKKGEAGDAPDRFDRPTDVAVAPGGEFYVTDGYGNSRVMKFDRDGKLLKQWGKKGSGEGEFNLPHAVCLDAKGRVYVGDRENNRIQVFDADGKFLAQWKESGAPFGLFLAGDRWFVADGRANWVRVLDADGKPLGRWGEKGTAAGQFQLPHMLCVDLKGSVYVAEVTGKRIQKFNPE